MELSLKLALGFLYGLLSGLSLLLNVVTLLAVFKLAFVVRKNHVYIISFLNILSDVIQMIAATFYLAPSIVTSSFLISTTKKDPWTLAISSSFMFLWYFESVLQIVMALNRYVVICLRNHKVFTFTSTSVLFLVIIPICLTLMYYSQYLSPCCSFMYDQEFLSYSYYEIPSVPNYSNTFVDLPLNTSSSVIASICYALIFWKIRYSSPIVGSMAEVQHRDRRNRNIRCAFQFSLLQIS